MFMQIKKTILTLIVSALLASLNLSPAVGQTQTGNTQLKAAAQESFSQQQFKEALSAYKKLMNTYPRDPIYRYYAGVCMVELNADLEQAVELLYYASSRGVPEDVHFYLAEAYRKMYDFGNAKKYYLEFDREASRTTAKEMDSKLLIRSADEATRITALYNPFEVLAVTFMDLGNPAEYEQVKMKGGNLTRKPAEFFSDGEDLEALTALMFSNDKVRRGEYVYFSGYERNRKKGSQIFRARKGQAGKWTDIEAIDILCSDGDEILPYFDPVGDDIYFATDGREGIGGFDLYRSHYDAERDEWETPVNMGFPINSAYDDYLLLPGTDLGKVVFFSGRQYRDGAVAVYRVHLSEPKVSLASASPKEIARIASLGGVASEALEEMDSYSAGAVREEVAQQQDDDVKPSTGTEANAERVQKAEIKVDQQYRQLVSKALGHQSVADSLRELSSRARMRIRESDDPNDRWLYQKQIMVWDKKAAAEQDSADQLFASIASYEMKAQPAAPVHPETLEVDTVIEDMTVYRYRQDDEEPTNAADGISREADTKDAEEVTGPAKRSEAEEISAREELVEPKQVTDRFHILATSPYHTDNPIPVDPALPGGAFYRIQLGAFSNPVEPDAFGGISPITAETVPDRGLIRYYAGKFSQYTAAERALTELRNNGHPDAYLVAWYNGTKMSIDRVRKLEK